MSQDTTKITYILFGATGNLAQIKIMPALCALFESGKLSCDSQIIAYSRRPWNDSEYREFIKSSLKKYGDAVVIKFLELITYVQGEFGDANSYGSLKSKIANDNVFIHLAVLPESYVEIVNGLGGAGINGYLLVEKPFGHSSDSAEDLERRIEKYFSEDKIFRIDHYLGKPGVQAILDKRINDPVFESKLNNKNVTKIICRFREVIDVSGRGEFYDNVGAFLDMGQSHGLEVLATVLMNIGSDLNMSRAEVIESLSYVPRSFIRGQYLGYREEKGVKECSETETYFKVSLQSFSDRWSDVFIIMESGKALESNERKEEVVIEYNDQSRFVFNIDLPKHYNAYEKVIEKAFEHDKSVFVSLKEVMSLWKCADEVVSSVKAIPMLNYNKGQGPNLIS
jgi:glucose-6-phosphate 1-dehydrogenase